MPNSFLSLPVLMAGLFFLLSLFLNGLLYSADLGQFDVLTAFPDAQGYAMVGQALLFGTPADEGLVSLRGYAYPIIAVGLATVSPLLLILVQTAAISVGLGLLAIIERRLTGLILVTPLALLSVSLLLAPGLMATEAIAFLLGAAALYAFVVRNTPWVGVLILGVAFLIKPAFLPILLLSLATLRLHRKSLAALAVLAALVAPNFLTSAHHDDTAGLTAAGSANFSSRFYPAVYGEVEGFGIIAYTSAQATAARMENPKVRQQVAYVLSHPVAAVRIWSHLLWDSHLMQASGFAKIIDRRGSHTLKRLSGLLNKILLCTAALGMIGLVYFAGHAGWRLWPAALLAPSLFASAPLVYWQGDRIILLPLLYLLPVAGLAIHHLFLKAKHVPAPRSG